MRVIIVQGPSYLHSGVSPPPPSARIGLVVRDNGMLPSALRNITIYRIGPCAVRVFRTFCADHAFDAFRMLRVFRAIRAHDLCNRSLVPGQNSGQSGARSCAALARFLPGKPPRTCALEGQGARYVVGCKIAAAAGLMARVRWQAGRGALLHSPAVLSGCHHTRMYTRRSKCSISGGLQRSAAATEHKVRIRRQAGRGAVLHSPAVLSRCHHTRMRTRRSGCSFCGGLQRSAAAAGLMASVRWQAVREAHDCYSTRRRNTRSSSSSQQQRGGRVWMGNQMGASKGA